MREIFITRVDNLKMGAKRNVAFTVDVDTDDFYTMDELNKLRKDLEYVTSLEEEIKEMGILQSTDMDHDGVTVMCEQTVSKDRLEFSNIYVRSDDGLFSLETLEDAEVMCDMLDSIIKDEESKR